MPHATPISSARRPANVGRADLLRLLVQWGPGAEHQAAAWTGFRYVAPEPAEPHARDIPSPTQAAPVAEPPSKLPPLRAQHYSVVQSELPPDATLANYARRLAESAQATDVPPTLQVRPPPPLEPLASARRLAVFAEKHLRQRQPGSQWDVPRLVRQLAAGRPPVARALRRLRWAGDALVFQWSQHTLPLHQDYRALAAVVQRRSGARAPIYRQHEGAWQRYAPDTTGRTLWQPLAHTPALAAGAGVAVGWPAGQAQVLPGWQPWVVLTAEVLPAQHAGAEVAWDSHLRLATKRQLPAAVVQVETLQLLPLLCLMVLCVTIAPALLRALRRLLPLPVAAELQAWNHPHVAVLGGAIALRRDWRNHYAEKLDTLDETLRCKAAHLVEAHHANLSLAIVLEELQLAHVHAPGCGLPDPALYYGALTRTLREIGDADQSAYLQRAGHRADSAVWTGAAAFALVWATANPDALRDLQQLPKNFPLELLPELRDAVSGVTAQMHTVRLRQLHDALLLEAVPPTAPPAGQILAEWPAADTWWQWRDEPAQAWQRANLANGPVRITCSDASTLVLTDGRRQCHVQAADRPAWALEWARDRKGLYAMAPNPWGEPQRVDFPQTLRDATLALFQHQMPAVRGKQTGAHLALALDPTGLLATLSLPSDITQAMRYIPPGSFLMGSPEEEEDREDDEGPQHRVTMSEGFWLADTACTQALWLAVMGGKNPSNFEGALELPVDSVSWDDVQNFLGKLQSWLPAGVQACLPSEAQWEYACRAGSTTPFSFAETITPAQVNYDGDHPYGDTAKGEYRQKTVPVKALPANDWGLYQMHGNVLEWCADGIREYAGEAQTDPMGPQDQAEKAPRGLRGGAWFVSALYARSAQRYRYQRDYRYHFVGLRFALRSTSPGAGGPVLARDGPAVAAAVAAAPRGTRAKNILDSLLRTVSPSTRSKPKK